MIGVDFTHSLYTSPAIIADSTMYFHADPTHYDLYSFPTRRSSDLANLSYTIVSGVGHGSLTGTGPGFSYTPAQDFNGSDSFTFKVTDRGDPDTCTGPAPACDGSHLSSETKTFTITVNAVNDPPVNHVPADRTLNEDATKVFSTANGNAITVTDVDGGSATEKVTLTATNGTVTLGSTTGLTVTGNGTATLVATGTLAALNSGLNGTTYAPAANYNGPAGLTVLSNDQGNTGTGGYLTDSDTIGLTVNPVNDTPTAIDGGTTMNEDAGPKSIDLSSLVADVETGDAN